MKIIGFEIKHCNAGWRDFSFLKINTDEDISGLSEYNECYGSPGLSIIISRFMSKIINQVSNLFILPQKKSMQIKVSWESFK